MESDNKLETGMDNFMVTHPWKRAEKVTYEMQQCINKMILNDDESDRYEVKHKEGSETKIMSRLSAVCLGLPNLLSNQTIKNHVVFARKGEHLESPSFFFL